MKVVQALSALAQESRLRLYRLLVKRGPEGFSAGQLGERLEIPGPTLSFHLKALAQAGLLTVRKESRFIYYSANFERAGELVEFLTAECCSLGSSCSPACAPAKATKQKRSA